MAQEYDLTEGLDPSALANISAAQLLQMVRNILPKSSRSIIIVSDSTPNVVDSPNLKRYLWIKPSENYAVVRRYNETTPAWEPITLGAGSIGTTQLADGSVTLAKLYNPADITKAFYFLRVNAAGTGFELSQFTLVAGSVTISTFSPGVGNNNKLIKVKSDGSGFEFFTLNAVDYIADKTVGIAKIYVDNTVSNKLIRVKGDGSFLEFFTLNAVNYIADGALPLIKLAPGPIDSILRTDGTGSLVWSASSVSGHFTEIDTQFVSTRLGSAISFAHSFPGYRPDVFGWRLKCHIVDAGFTVGDEINCSCVSVNLFVGGAINNQTMLFTEFADNTFVGVSVLGLIGGTTPTYAFANKVGTYSYIDLTKWKLKCFAFLF